MFRILFLIFIQSVLSFGWPLRLRAFDSLTPQEITPKKMSVVTFLSIQCPCSKGHEKTLASLAKEFPDFEFLGAHANQDERYEDAKKYFAGANLPFPVYSDPKAALADELRAVKTPHVFVLDTGGQVLYRGGVDDTHDADTNVVSQRYLRDALLALREGRKPNPAMTRVLGCEISR